MRTIGKNCPFSIRTKGGLGGQLRCLRMLVSEFGPELPIIQTIFSPLSQAKHLVAPGELPVHIHAIQMHSKRVCADH